MARAGKWGSSMVAVASPSAHEATCTRSLQRTEIAGAPSASLIPYKTAKGQKTPSLWLDSAKRLVARTLGMRTVVSSVFGLDRRKAAPARDGRSLSSRAERKLQDQLWAFVSQDR